LPDSDVDDGDSADERRHAPLTSMGFHNPADFDGGSRSNPVQGRGGPSQGRLVFMRGYMSARWINTIGARYVVDPEFFCRHLDFRPRDDPSSTFSTPALPSSSWHLIELPVMAIGTRMAPKGPVRLESIDGLRDEGAEALAAHHHRIARLSSSDMAVGESMYRQFYVFDETHFAVEQRISICMQPGENGGGYVGDYSLPFSPPFPSAGTNQRLTYLIPLQCSFGSTRAPTSLPATAAPRRRGRCSRPNPTTSPPSNTST
jgi:hypothetical protein